MQRVPNPENYPGIEVKYRQIPFAANELYPGYTWSDSSHMWQQRVGPMQNSPPGALCPKFQDTYYKSKWAFRSPLYNSDLKPPCELLDPGGINYSACTASDQTTYTASGLTLQQMRQQYSTAPSQDILDHVAVARPPVCTTHDSIQFPGGSTPYEKFLAVESEFQVAWNKISSNLAVRADALGKMATEVATLSLLRPYDDEINWRLSTILSMAPDVPTALCGTKYQVLDVMFSKSLWWEEPEQEARNRLDLLTRVLAKPVPDAAADRQEEVNRRIYLIGKWYATTPPSEYPVDGRDVDEARVVSAFYQGIYAPELAKLKSLAGGTTANDVLSRGQALQEIFARNFRADREVLTALYPPKNPQDPTTTTLPLMGPIAARMTGAALVGITQRLRSLGTLHDYACAFVDCTKPMPTEETVKGIWSMLAALPVQQDLQAALAKVPETNEWRVALRGIAEHHAAFLQSVGAGSPTNTFTVPAPDAPAYAGDLARVVEDARVRVSTFAKTGTFELAGRNTLQQNLDDVRVDGAAVSNILNSSAANLSTTLTNYTGHRDTLITRLATEIDDAGRENATTAQVVETTTNLNIVSDELSALRLHTNEDAAKFGDFLKAFGTTIDSDGTEDQRISRDAPTTFTANAKGPHSGADLKQIAVTIGSGTGGTPIPAKSGELLNLQVSGDWSPVCAIKSQFDARKAVVNGAPEAGGRTFDVKYALAGPEGYHEQTADDTVLTVGKSTSDSSSSTTGNRMSASLCLEIESGSPDFVKVIIGGSAKIKASACDQIYADKSSSSVSGSNAASNDSVRRSASFQSGIRVRGTVNPQMPAGALLMYTMPKGFSTLDRALDVQVVHRNDGVLVKGDPNIAGGAVDLYFVVNDGTCNDASGQLTVTAQKYTTVGAIAKDVGAKMATALNNLRAAGDIYAKQGVILPSESAALRDGARTAVGADLSRMPDVVKGLFELWVDIELARIDRSVEIRKRLLAVDAYVRQLATLRSSLDTSTAKNRLATQLSYWAMQMLEADDLINPVRDVTTAYGSRLRPILRLRYPTLAACLGGKAPDGAPPGQATDCTQAQTHFNQLLNATTSQPLSELANSLVTSAADVRKIITNYDPHVQPQRLDIAVRVPNPFVKYCGSGGGWDDPASADDCVQPIRTAAQDEIVAKTRLTANPIVARAMWSALLGTPPGGTPVPVTGTFFRLSPEDVYSSVQADKDNSLPCNQGAPIVNQMAIVVGNTGEGKDRINAAQKAGVVSRESTFVFTTSQGPELFDFQLGGAQNATFNVPLLDAHYDQYLTTYNAERSGPSGSRFNIPLSSSPFTGYRLFVSDTSRLVFGSQLTTAPEVYLVMTTDVLPLSNVGWVTSCR